MTGAGCGAGLDTPSVRRAGDGHGHFRRMGHPLRFDNYGAGPPVRPGRWCVPVPGVRRQDSRAGEAAVGTPSGCFTTTAAAAAAAAIRHRHAVQRGGSKTCRPSSPGPAGPRRRCSACSSWRGPGPWRRQLAGTPITRPGAVTKRPFHCRRQPPPRFPPDYLAQLKQVSWPLGRRGGAVRFWLRMVGVPGPRGSP